MTEPARLKFGRVQDHRRKVEQGEVAKIEGKDRVLSLDCCYGFDSELTWTNGDGEINCDARVVVEAAFEVAREVLGILALNNVVCDPKRMRGEYFGIGGVVSAPPDTPFRVRDHIVCDLSREFDRSAS